MKRKRAGDMDDDDEWMAHFGDVGSLHAITEIPYKKAELRRLRKHLRKKKPIGFVEFDKDDD